MNSLAQQALDRAFGKTVLAPKGKTTKTLGQTDVKAPKQPSSLPQLNITGPINRVMELEGKRYAVGFVQALGSSINREPVRTKAIADLTRYAAQQPASVASGVKIVIDLLKGA